MEAEEIKGRLESLRGFMAENNMRAFVVRDVTNIAWLTGFEGVFDDERAHTLVVTADKAILHTDSRYATAMNLANLAGGRVYIVDSKTDASGTAFVNRILETDARKYPSVMAVKTGVAEETPQVVDTAENEATDEAAAPSLPLVPTFGIEDDITLAEFRALSQTDCVKGVAPAETHHAIRKLRAVKSPAEIALMKEAQRITDEAFAHMVSFVQPGMTERDVQLELEDYMAWAGSPKVSFASIVAAGGNAAKPHSVPGSTKLQAGQVLLLDFGATWMGYHADMTRCIFLGQPLPLMERIYNTVVKANEAAQEMLKPGVTGAEVQACVERILAGAGYGGKMGHGVGHGVGMEIHEEPTLNARSNEPLVVGNVVTVEPGIYLPEGLVQKINIPMGGTHEISLLPATGIRVEDCGAITEEGFDCFTQTSHELVII